MVMPYNKDVGQRDGPAGVAHSPGPGPQPLPAKEVTVDKDILACSGRTVRADQAQESSEETKRGCFYCLEGWVFLGSIAHEGEEVVEAIRCRRCKGTGEMNG
jgi:hypothetical protein